MAHFVMHFLQLLQLSHSTCNQDVLTVNSLFQGLDLDNRHNAMENTCHCRLNLFDERGRSLLHCNGDTLLDAVSDQTGDV